MCDPVFVFLVLYQPETLNFYDGRTCTLDMSQISYEIHFTWITEVKACKF